MKSPASLVLVLLLVVALIAPPTPVPAANPQAQAEIEQLIVAIEKSGARFVRNGQEYGAKEGADHMRRKLKAGGDRIKSTEDFINGAATKSSISGKPYLMKTPAGEEIPPGEMAERKARGIPHGEKVARGSMFSILWNERFSTYVYYDGELGRANYHSHNISAGVRLQF